MGHAAPKRLHAEAIKAIRARAESTKETIELAKQRVASAHQQIATNEALIETYSAELRDLESAYRKLGGKDWL